MTLASPRRLLFYCSGSFNLSKVLRPACLLQKSVTYRSEMRQILQYDIWLKIQLGFQKFRLEATTSMIRQKNQRFQLRIVRIHFVESKNDQCRCILLLTYLLFD